MTLADVLALVVPHGWFLPVTPGTKYVSVAGAVANDVHGKNHHAAGTFGRFVTRLELRRSSGETLELTPEAPLFRATVAGLGPHRPHHVGRVPAHPIESDQIAGRSTNSRASRSSSRSAKSPLARAPTSSRGSTRCAPRAAAF